MKGERREGMKGEWLKARGERTKMKNERTKNMKRILIMTVIMTSMVLATSCNVTRVVTNESQYLQKGDTSVVIQTKTVETYDASRKY